MAVVLVVAAALVTSWPAGAESGSFQDPDDVTPAAAIDVKTLSHSDTATQITYTMEAYQSWPADTEYDLEWHLDFDGDVDTVEACVLVSKFADSAVLEATVHDGDCGGDVIGEATAERTNESVEVTFDIAALEGATDPLEGDEYAYRFVAFDLAEETEDHAPNAATAQITHTLGEPAPTTTSTTGGATTSTTAGGTTTTTAGGTTTTTTAGGTTTTTAAGGTTTTTSGAATTTTTAACPSPSRATVTPSTAAPGQQVTVRGGGPGCFKPNQTLTVVYNSTPQTLGTTTSDGFGQYAVIVNIPRNTTSGSHTITVSGPAASSGTHQSIGGITITRSGSLPRTGSDSGDVARLALLAIGGGAILVLSAKRSREFVLATARHQAKHFRR